MLKDRFMVANILLTGFWIIVDVSIFGAYIVIINSRDIFIDNLKFNFIRKRYYKWSITNNLI